MFKIGRKSAFVLVFDNTGYCVTSQKFRSKKVALNFLPYLIDHANRHNEWVDHTAMVRTKNTSDLYEFSYAPRPLHV